MTHAKADALLSLAPIYLDDQFLDRYEQSSFYDTTPFKNFGRWYCNPSYLGQWGFTECVRIGRNLIQVPVRELYKPKPDREIIHAYGFARDPSEIATIDMDEEHIVTKTDRFLAQLLDLGDGLSALGKALGIPSTAEELIKFSREELRRNGWLHYPELSRLAQVAPLSMTEQAFLSRCKSIHEIWQRIPNGNLRRLVESAGHAPKSINSLGSLKLLQALSNILERLNSDGEQVGAFGSNPQTHDIADRNVSLAALFVNNDLRIADAHDSGEVLVALESLGFDIAEINKGYGRALDFVFDGVINAFTHINQNLQKLLGR